MYMYVHTPTHTYIYTHTFTHTPTHIYTCIYMIVICLDWLLVTTYLTLHHDLADGFIHMILSINSPSFLISCIVDGDWNHYR